MEDFTEAGCFWCRAAAEQDEGKERGEFISGKIVSDLFEAIGDGESVVPLSLQIVNLMVRLRHNGFATFAIHVHKFANCALHQFFLLPVS